MSWRNYVTSLGFEQNGKGLDLVKASKKTIAVVVTPTRAINMIHSRCGDFLQIAAKITSRDMLGTFIFALKNNKIKISCKNVGVQEEDRDALFTDVEVLKKALLSLNHLNINDLEVTVSITSKTPTS